MRAEPQTQFLTICWEEAGEDGVTVTRRATLCLLHRQEIALRCASARGLRQLGQSCDSATAGNPGPWKSRDGR